MGIDRKDVRIVCHFNIPKSMEAFYQESGRTGRDQLPSRSLLYYGVNDRKRMEFILGNAKNKKSQSSSSQDVTSKKSLADFRQMVEYCEESSCRRKKILENFGEEVPGPLCGKTCDACKHPNLVAKYLEELTTACTFRNQSSRVFISSSEGLNDEEQFSEFWNHDEAASGSEEDISDADEDDVAKSMVQSSSLTNARLNDRIEFLQRAEESYYRNKVPDKQVNKIDKNTISETLRESGKERLLNAMKQNQQRFNDLQIDYETSAMTFENACYNKYGKSGKSFYISQIASTVRWISTANAEELINRLNNTVSPVCKATLAKSHCSLPSVSPTAGVSIEQNDEKLHISSGSRISVGALEHVSEDKKLPTIPSFSDFINSRKPDDTQSLKKPDKRMRYQ